MWYIRLTEKEGEKPEISMAVHIMNDIVVRSSYGVFLMAEVINGFKERLQGRIDNDVVINMNLFGSYARNIASDDSDIDICIIYDEYKISELNINLIVDDISDELLGEYGAIIHALCFSRSYYNANSGSSRLFKDIDREGIPC